VYLDVVSIVSQTFQEQHDNIKKVSQTMRVRVQTEPQDLFQDEVWYLGHTVSPEEAIIDPEKVRLYANDHHQKTNMNCRASLFCGPISTGSQLDVQTLQSH
jgi:hypothetical protein